MYLFFSGICDNLRHRVPLVLHICHQLELGTAAVQILLGIVDTEIIITIDVIGQEAGAALQSHGKRTQRQNFLFLLGQTGAGFQIASGEQPEQLQIHPNLA